MKSRAPVPRHLRLPLLITLCTLPALAVLGCDTDGATQSPDPEQVPPPAPAAATAGPQEAAARLAAPATGRTELLPAVEDYVVGLPDAFEDIEPERRENLDRLATFVRERVAAGEPAALTFICTHNSRRSQMGQIWAAVAASYYGIEGVETYSGGTESTAFNPRAVAALERAGLRIEPGSEADLDAEPNPHHEVRYSEARPALEAFSKTFDHEANPKDGFAAIMTCSAADAACPFVPGAALRVANPYEDPKAADGTDEERSRYDERCRQIATEMFYLMARAAT